MLSKIKGFINSVKASLQAFVSDTGGILQAVLEVITSLIVISIGVWVFLQIMSLAKISVSIDPIVIAAAVVLGIVLSYVALFSRGAGGGGGGGDVI